MLRLNLHHCSIQVQVGRRQPLSRISIVTGAASRIGFELVTPLYSGNGDIYIAAHPPEKVAAPQRLSKTVHLPAKAD